jgi:hypothetical protein
VGLGWLEWSRWFEEVGVQINETQRDTERGVDAIYLSCLVGLAMFQIYYKGTCRSSVSW